MTRQEKISLVKTLSDSFREAGAVVVCDYRGLSVKQLESLRRDSRNAGVCVQVVKNKLAKLALSGAGYPAAELKLSLIHI